MLGPNLYTYVNNNPVNYTDQFGLTAIDPFGNKVPGIIDRIPIPIDRPLGDKVPNDPLSDRSDKIPQEDRPRRGDPIYNDPSRPKSDPISPQETAPFKKSGDRTPAKGEPGSVKVFPDGEGGVTIRVYGPDGKALIDIDFGHEHGVGDPHIHGWDWTQEKPREQGMHFRSYK